MRPEEVDDLKRPHLHQHRSGSGHRRMPRELESLSFSAIPRQRRVQRQKGQSLRLGNHAAPRMEKNPPCPIGGNLRSFDEGTNRSMKRPERMNPGEEVLKLRQSRSTRQPPCRHLQLTPRPLMRPDRMTPPDRHPARRHIQAVQNRSLVHSDHISRGDKP